jgi:hypothetical protein
VADDFVSDDVVGVAAGAAADSVFVVVDEDVVDSEEPGFAELYKSEYQPPPFKMKPPLREIWRWASSAPQLGQVLRGASLMDCSASHWWLQALQRYS